jgi:hypothetical protein
MRVRPSQIRPRAAVAAACGALALALAFGDVAAMDPAGSQVIQQMRAALEPDKPSVRQINLTVLGETPTEKTTFQLVQARKRLPDGRRSLTVLTGPPAARGLAYLVEEKKGQVDPVEYIYVPMVRRVRKLVGAENQTSFLDSDFTYADLGFLPSDSQDSLAGEEKVGGRDVFKIESIPGSEIKKWYYSKIATWVDKESLLPVQRDFYGPNGQVFKIQTFGEATRVDGIPTILETTMESVGAKSHSKLEVTNVAYGKDLPDELFSPAKLSQIADAVDKAGLTKPK